MFEFVVKAQEFIRHEVICAADSAVRAHCETAEAHLVKAVEYGDALDPLLKLLEGEKVGRGMFYADEALILEYLGGDIRGEGEAVAAGEVIDDHRQAHARHDVVVILADSVI